MTAAVTRLGAGCLAWCPPCPHMQVDAHCHVAWYSLYCGHNSTARGLSARAHSTAGLPCRLLRGPGRKQGWRRLFRGNGRHTDLESFPIWDRSAHQRVWHFPNKQLRQAIEYRQEAENPQAKEVVLRDGTTAAARCLHCPRATSDEVPGGRGFYLVILYYSVKGNKIYRRLSLFETNVTNSIVAYINRMR